MSANLNKINSNTLEIKLNALGYKVQWAGYDTEKGAGGFSIDKTVDSNSQTA